LLDVHFRSLYVTYPGNAPEMSADSSFIVNPIMPINIIPAEHIFMVSQSSVLLGLRASLSNLKHDLMKELNPKAAHPFIVLRTKG